MERWWKVVFLQKESSYGTIWTKKPKNPNSEWAEGRTKLSEISWCSWFSSLASISSAWFTVKWQQKKKTRTGHFGNFPTSVLPLTTCAHGEKLKPRWRQRLTHQALTPEQQYWLFSGVDDVERQKEDGEREGWDLLQAEGRPGGGRRQVAFCKRAAGRCWTQRFCSSCFIMWTARARTHADWLEADWYGTFSPSLLSHTSLRLLLLLCLLLLLLLRLLPPVMRGIPEQGEVHAD